MQSYLSLEDVTVAYGAVIALQSLSLDVKTGEFFCLLGPSGSGKTTALGVIAGFSPAVSGRVLLAGDDITRIAPQKRQLGIVFQSYALFPHMTAAENVGYALKVRGAPKSRIDARALELLDLVKLGAKGHRYPRQMSGGEQQRVAIARALAIEPRLMLLDEPLSNLDAKLREEMRIELRRIQRETGVTTILVTHDQEEAFGLGDRIAVMNKGQIEQVGTPEELYWDPKTHFVAGFLGQANVLNGDLVGDAIHIGGTSFRAARIEARPGPASLFLRPEEIRLGGEPAENAITGHVDSISALGSTLHVRVETRAGMFLAYRLSELNQPIRQGSEVTLSWPVTAGRIMERAA
jgi:putative spermidine/putrescine transport system ATP-binding protein